MEEKQMKTLGGYEIVDEKARQDIHAVSEKADEALSLAKGATKVFVYDTYADMISELNALDKAELLVNYHVMIRTMCVPDLWISGVSDEHVKYTYTSNEDFIVDLTEDGIVQVGYFVLSALETQKVELTDYVKNTDYAVKNGAHGLVKIDESFGVGLPNGASNPIAINPATKEQIDAKSSPYRPITPSVLDYAVMKALSDSKLEWTDEQKKFARELIGSVGSEDYASNTVAGVMRVIGTNGLRVDSTGVLGLTTNTDDELLNKTGKSALKPTQIDKIVKSGLAYCLLEWTDEEKAKALELLGGLKKSTEKTTFHEVYAKSADGTTQWEVGYSQGANAQTLAQRGVGGVLAVGTPTEDTHATTKKYVDDGFVGKRGGGITNILYGEYYMGTQNCFAWNNVPTPYTFYQSYDDGRLRVGEPVEDADATTKKYVDDNFVSKLTPEEQTPYLYGMDENGNPVLYRVFAGQAANRVQISDAYGCLSTADPRTDYNVANKRYVDNLVGDVQSILTELHAYAETLSGGDA